MARDAPDWLTESRTHYYDRDPNIRFHTTSVQAGDGLLAPTVQTVWTVAAGRAGLVELASAGVENRGSGGVNAVADVSVNLAVAGSGSGRAVVARLVPSGDRRDHAEVGSVGHLAAGDSVSIQTRSDNNAVGSNVILEGAFKATEYAPSR